MQRLAGRRSCASPSSASASFGSSGAFSTKRRRRRTSAANCCLRAVAYRMQEVALGGLRPERQRQLRQFAQQLNGSQEVRIRPRPELKPGTRLVREWQGRTYDVVVLDDGFSWQARVTARFPPSRERSPAQRGRGTALLRIEAEPHRCSQALAGTPVQPERAANAAS